MTRYGQPDLLMWLDLETTGTDHIDDQIIEIGAIFTTPDLDEFGSIAMFVAPTPTALGRLMLNPVVRKMHTDNGLLDDVLALAAEADAGEADLAETDEFLDGFLNEVNVDSGRPKRQPFVLAGSGVAHFDRRFIDHQLPRVARRLRYWCIDVGVIRRAHRMWTDAPHPSGSKPPKKPHRALDDARLHLDEARAFRDLWTKENQ